MSERKNIQGCSFPSQNSKAKARGWIGLLFADGASSSRPRHPAEGPEFGTQRGYKVRRVVRIGRLDQVVIRISSLECYGHDSSGRTPGVQSPVGICGVTCSRRMEGSIAWPGCRTSKLSSRLKKRRQARVDLSQLIDSIGGRFSL